VRSPYWPLLAALVASPSFAAKATVPVDIGVGPAAYWFFGPLTDNRGAMPHFGLKINVLAVIDQEVIKANRDKVPAEYRKMAEKMTEVRISPSIFIPDSFIISPKVDSLGGTGVYGVTWRPVGFGIPLAGGTKPGSWQKNSSSLDLKAGLLITYAFIYSDFKDAVPTTHFIRPGIDLSLEAEVMVSKNFLVSIGWASQFYIPQKLGEFGINVRPLEDSIVHVGQGFLKLHFRTPYEATF
jgi:hypothetical protein